MAGVSASSPCLINSAVMACRVATPIMITKVVLAVARACQLSGSAIAGRSVAGDHGESLCELAVSQRYASQRGPRDRR